MGLLVHLNEDVDPGGLKSHHHRVVRNSPIYNAPEPVRLLKLEEGFIQVMATPAKQYGWVRVGTTVLAPLEYQPVFPCPGPEFGGSFVGHRNRFAMIWHICCSFLRSRYGSDPTHAE